MSSLATIEDTAGDNTLAVPVRYAKPVGWTPRFIDSADVALAINDEKRKYIEKLFVEGQHYGTIPGAKKPVLYKPGAELLCARMGLHPEFEELEVIHDFTGRDHEGEPFIYYRFACLIYVQTGPAVTDRMLVAKASGSCNSWEVKYRYRESQRLCPHCQVPAIIKGKEEYGGGWVCYAKKGGCGAKFKDNDTLITGQVLGRTKNADVVELDNTLVKMGQKRGLIAATLIASGCSDIFTQDLEDGLPDDGSGDPAADKKPRRTLTGEQRNNFLAQASNTGLDQNTLDQVAFAVTNERVQTITDGSIDYDEALSIVDRAKAIAATRKPSTTPATPSPAAAAQTAAKPAAAKPAPTATASTAKPAPAATPKAQPAPSTTAQRNGPRATAVATASARVGPARSEAAPKANAGATSGNASAAAATEASTTPASLDALKAEIRSIAQAKGLTEAQLNAQVLEASRRFADNLDHPKFNERDAGKLLKRLQSGAPPKHGPPAFN